MKHLASITITAIMLAALLAGYLLPHDHEHHEEQAEEHECIACVFHHEHLSLSPDITEVASVWQVPEQPVLPVVIQTRFHYEQAPSAPRAPPFFS